MCALDAQTQWDGVQGSSKARALYRREKLVCSLKTVLCGAAQSTTQH